MFWWHLEDGNILYDIAFVDDLQEELADLFKLNTYKIIDNEILKEMFDELSITNSDDRPFAISDYSVCSMCKFMVAQIKRHHITLMKFAKSVCKMYVMLTTATLTDFCEDLAKMQLVNI